MSRNKNIRSKLNLLLGISRWNVRQALGDDGLWPRNQIKVATDKIFQAKTELLVKLSGANTKKIKRN